jgi:hypothetical protein
MNEQTKLILALMQIENIVSLTENNEYQQFLYSHLISIQSELQRQLTNLTQSSKINNDALIR